MTTQTSTSALPGQPSNDPIIATLEFFSSMAYDDIQPGGKDYDKFQRALTNAERSEWQRIVVSDSSDVDAQEHYQGIAFYNAKTNRAVIANRGSQSAYDLLVSDAAISVGNDPSANKSALKFYND